MHTRPKAFHTKINTEEHPINGEKSEKYYITMHFNFTQILISLHQMNFTILIQAQPII
jgi:hypothetical protein